MTVPRTAARQRARVAGLLLALVAALAAVAVGPASPASAATGDRTFVCHGNLGRPYTFRTVTGSLSNAGRPYAVRVINDSTGAVDSDRIGWAGGKAASWLHPGYVQWNITGPNPARNVYWLHIPPVLPGGGGFFDADLEILFEGGALGNWQIPAFDCAVTGGPAWLASGGGPRTFTCHGTAGDLLTAMTVTGSLTLASRPVDVTVTQDATGAILSHRVRQAVFVGPSATHPGYTEWDITGQADPGTTYHLSTAPVLPRVGGFFDADLDVSYGAAGGLQIPMIDCTVA